MSTRGFAAARGEFTGDRSDDAQQRRVQNIEQVLNENPFLRGKLHKAVVFATAFTDTTLTHNFGREAGVMVVGIDRGGTAAFILFPSPTQPDVKTVIVLQSTQSCTVDIWLWPRGT